MTVESKLEEAFIAYLNLAKAKLHPRLADPSKVVAFDLLRNRSIELRRLVEGLETRREFHDLVKQTLVACPRKETEGRQISDSFVSRVVEIQNFFRRSRCYTSIYNAISVDPLATLSNLKEEFWKDKIETRYLIPLKSVGFSEKSIELTDFRIRRFSAEELEEVLQIDVTGVFYEWSTVDIRKLKGYWFVDFSQSQARSPVQVSVDNDGMWETDTSVGDASLDKLSVIEEFSAFPNASSSDQVALTRVLEPLILYDWESLEHNFSARGVRLEIPFFLKTHDDLLQKPPWAPTIPAFEVGPFSFEPEEVEPEHYVIFIKSTELSSFRSFIADIDRILSRMRAAQWLFLKLALMFLTRAFFSEGLLQLLWHIFVVDALLGEDKKSRLMKERLQSIHAGIEPNAKKIFEGIYALRNRLVHGDADLLGDEARDTQLRQARSLARRTLVWFLHYTDHVVRHSRNNDLPPERIELLRALDNGRSETINLPTDFPTTPTWFDDAKRVSDSSSQSHLHLVPPSCE